MTSKTKPSIYVREPLKMIMLHFNLFLIPFLWLTLMESTGHIVPSIAWWGLPLSLNSSVFFMYNLFRELRIWSEG